MYSVPKVIIRCAYCGMLFEASDKKIKNRAKYGYQIRFCSKDCGNKSRRTREIVNCLNCGKEFESTRIKCCSRKCADEYKIKSGSTKKGGFWLENGYKVLYVEGDNHIKEHIHVMELYIGRKLFSNECVHHINGDITDNRLENLQLMTKSEHSSYHRKLELSRGKVLFGK